MEWQSIVLGPFSMAAGILALLVVLPLSWVTGKVEGYDPIDEMLRRDNAALGIRYALLP
jgi:hypothetical protein